MEEIIAANPKPIKEAKKDELERGLLHNSEKIGRYKSPPYASYKNTLNPRAGLGNVDLILSGKYQQSQTPNRTQQNKYQFTSDLPYAKYLNNRYGKDITGLNQTEFIKIQKEHYLRPFVEALKSKLGL